MILIPIDMPSNCWDCSCHDGEFLFCQVLEDGKRDWEIEQDLGKKRRDNCPLREVTPPINDMLETLINEQQETINKHFADLKNRYEKMQEVKNGFKGGSVPLLAVKK